MRFTLSLEKYFEIEKKLEFKVAGWVKNIHLHTRCRGGSFRIKPQEAAVLIKNYHDMVDTLAYNGCGETAYEYAQDLLEIMRKGYEQ
jgi:hypothetical protein